MNHLSHAHHDTNNATSCRRTQNYFSKRIITLDMSQTALSREKLPLNATRLLNYLKEHKLDTTSTSV